MYDMQVDMFGCVLIILIQNISSQFTLPDFLAVSATYGILLTCTFANRDLQYFITMLIGFVSSDVFQFTFSMK